MTTHQSEKQFFAEWESKVLEEARTLLLGLKPSASQPDSIHGKLVSVYASPAWIDESRDQYVLDITCVANGHLKVNWSQLQLQLVTDGRESNEKLPWTSHGHCRISGESAGGAVSFADLPIVPIPLSAKYPPMYWADAGARQSGEEDDPILATIPVAPQSDSLLRNAWIDLRPTLRPEIYAKNLPNGFHLNHNGRVVVTLSIKGQYFPDEVNGIRLSTLSPDETETPAYIHQLLERDEKALLEFAIPPDSVQAWCQDPHFVARVAVESDSPRKEDE